VLVHVLIEQENGVPPVEEGSQIFVAAGFDGLADHISPVPCFCDKLRLPVDDGVIVVHQTSAEVVMHDACPALTEAHQ
jgi:hypothetical protein